MDRTTQKKENGYRDGRCFTCRFPEDSEEGRNLTLQHTPKFSHQTPSYLLSPALVSSLFFLGYNKPTYTTYELRYRFHPKKLLLVHPPFSFHVFLGPIPTDTGSEAWFNSASRISEHGISASHYGGVSGTIPLTRVLLEKCGTLEVGSVLPYLRRELRWIVEKDDGAAVGLDLLSMFEVEVASAEVSIEESEVGMEVFYESVVDGMQGRLK